MNFHFNINHILQRTLIVLVYWLMPIMLIVLIRLFLDQSHWLSMADNSYQNKNYIQAIVYNDRVLQAHIPFSPYEEKAKSNLMKIAKWGEENKDYKITSISIETLKSSSLYTDHLFSKKLNTNPVPNSFGVLLIIVVLFSYFIGVYLWITNNSIKVTAYVLGSFFVWCVLLGIV